MVIHRGVHNLLVTLCNSLAEVKIERMIGEMRWLFKVRYTINLYFYVTHLLKYIERMIGERIRDVVVIHSAIHN